MTPFFGKNMRVAGLVAAALTLSACGSESAEPREARVVASTNVYGSLAELVSGGEVPVDSIITSPTQDPHDHEASGQDALLLSKAKLVVENGGGYDPFVDKVLKSQSGEKPTVLTVVDLAEGGAGESHPPHDDHAHDHDHDHDHAHEGNEHVWYDLAVLKALTGELGHHIAEMKPESEAKITRNTTELTEKLGALEAEVQALKPGASGKGVVVTEPVALPLLEAAGLRNDTPEEMMAAVESGNDAAAAVVQQTVETIASKKVAVLVVNPQTRTAQTDQLVRAAKDASVPVVEMGETLPEGQDTVTWMKSNIDKLKKALTT